MPAKQVGRYESYIATGNDRLKNINRIIERGLLVPVSRGLLPNL